MSTERQKVDNGFRALRKLGYFARKNFWCCQTCGWAAMTDEQAKKAVFYHKQDQIGAWDGDDNLTQWGLYLSWAGDGKEICDVFRERGLDIEWDGTDSKRIKLVSKINVKEK